MDFQGVPLWDIPTDTYSNVTDEDFLALLSKEFPIQQNYAIPPTAVLDATHMDPDGINPASLTNFAAPVPGHATPPLTDDSSPSPPASSNDISHSRRQSNTYTDGEGLKRKASYDEDDEDDDDTGRRNPGDSSKKATTSTTRSLRKPGSSVGHKDEIRLARRKEQNRAAQRAFRERKEKHVKDLEDRVSELEDAQRAKESENDNLRDILHRLQEENQTLKQQFTFQVPHNGNGTRTPQHPQAQPQQQQPSQPTAGSSTPQYPTPPSGAQQPPVAPQSASADIDWSSLTTFDPAALSMLDEPQDVTMDFAGPPANGRSPYKTIATNPMFMSFAEPFAAWDGQLPSGAATHAASSPDSAAAFPAFNSFGSWAGAGSGWMPPHSQGGSMGSLDDLFGMNTPTMDFTQSPPVAPSLAHTSSTSSSSSSSPNFASYGGVGHSPNSLMSSPASTELSSPPSSTSSPAVEHQQHGGSCPRTKAEFAARIANELSSPFTTTSPSASAAPSPSASSAPGAAIKKTRDAVSGGAQITCSGSVFPQTEKSPMNIEVLAAWRDITSDPKFKDVDINELCAEFTNKAKCDGTKVVLDRQGVEEIKNKFSGRI